MNDFNKPSITVAISTIAVNVDRFISSFFFLPLIDADEVIIVIQGMKDKVSQPKLKDYTIIYDDQYGLSRSRNIAIENSECDFIWFLDDDVLLMTDCVKKIKKNLALNNNPALQTVRMKYLDGKPYKNYTKKKILGRIGSLRVSSVELVVSKNFLLKNHIRFNENLGLGSRFPSVEENIFFLDVFDKGGLVLHFPEFLLKHEFIDRKAMHFSNSAILKAKGMFCSRYGGFIGFLIFTYYLIKCMIVSGRLKLMLSLYQGYKNTEGIVENA